LTQNKECVLILRGVVLIWIWLHRRRKLCSHIQTNIIFTWHSTT